METNLDDWESNHWDNVTSCQDIVDDDIEEDIVGY